MNDGRIRHMYGIMIGIIWEVAGIVYIIYYKLLCLILIID